MSREAVGTHSPQHVQTVQARQLQTEENERRHQREVTLGMRPGPEQELERFHTVPRHGDFGVNATLAQGTNDQLLVVRIVFNEQYEFELLRHQAVLPSQGGFLLKHATVRPGTGSIASVFAIIPQRSSNGFRRFTN